VKCVKNSGELKQRRGAERTYTVAILVVVVVRHDEEFCLVVLRGSVLVLILLFVLCCIVYEGARVIVAWKVYRGEGRKLI